MKNLKESTEKVFQIIRNCSQIAGCKIKNINQAFIFTITTGKNNNNNTEWKKMSKNRKYDPI